MKKAKFSVEDVICEECGCEWFVLKVGRKNYHLEHVVSHDKILIHITYIDRSARKGDVTLLNLKKGEER
jgi:hypothetical protein